MTYLYYRDTDSDAWAVAQVMACGRSEVLKTFETASLARAYTKNLRGVGTGQMDQSDQSDVQMQ